MTRRYVVQKIDRFGDPTELSYWDDLSDALSERDLLRRHYDRALLKRDGFVVLDREDATRGPLDHIDAYEVNA